MVHVGHRQTKTRIPVAILPGNLRKLPGSILKHLRRIGSGKHNRSLGGISFRIAQVKGEHGSGGDRVLIRKPEEIIPLIGDEIPLAEEKRQDGKHAEHARAQGEEFGHGTKREIQYLTVHSMLHLLGYDHMDEGEQKRQMREREKDVMARLEGVREE